MVKASALNVGDPRFKSRSGQTSDVKTGILVAALSDTRRCRVGAKTGWPGVSILRLAETGYCGLRRQHISSAAYVSVWQHVELSEGICP